MYSDDVPVLRWDLSCPETVKRPAAALWNLAVRRLCGTRIQPAQETSLELWPASFLDARIVTASGLSARLTHAFARWRLSRG